MIRGRQPTPVVDGKRPQTQLRPQQLQLKFKRQLIGTELLINSEKSRQSVTQRGSGAQVIEWEETTCLETRLGLQ